LSLVADCLETRNAFLQRRAWLVFAVLFGLSLGNSWSFISHDLVSNSAHLRAFLPTGALGAAVGATLWLIARPDRGSA
jgi:hypothetical protein